MAAQNTIKTSVEVTTLFFEKLNEIIRLQVEAYHRIESVLEHNLHIPFSESMECLEGITTISQDGIEELKRLKVRYELMEVRIR